MKFTERLAQLLRPETNARESVVREALSAGRTAKFAEDYPTALDHFDRALILAADGDPSAITAISVHRADTLIRLRQWVDAAAFIDTSEANPPESTRVIHIAYMQCARGVLYQAQGNLDSARAQYETALAGAKNTNSGAEGRALGHLADILLRENNALYAVRLLRDALPKLSASNDIELSSYFVGLLGQALVETGQESEGQHLLQRALQLAEQFNYRLYARHWGMVLADRALAEARPLDAKGHYTRILRLFDPDHPTPAYIALCAKLSQVALDMRGDSAGALAYAEHAMTALATMDASPGVIPLDPPRALVQPEHLPALTQAALGLALRAVGRSADAIPYLEASLQSYSAQNHDSRETIHVLRSLGAAQADMGATNDAIRLYQDAITRSEPIGNALETAQSRRDLGVIYQKIGQPLSAAQEWAAALAIYEDKKAYAQIARLYCDLGSLRKMQGQTQRAMKDYEEALMALNNVDPADLATRGLVLSNAANAYADSGDSESADAFFSEAITLAERTDDKIADATRSGNYAWFLILMGRPRRAIAMLEKALRLSQSLKLHPQTAIQMDNLGLAHDSISEYERGAAYHRQALEQLNGASDPYWRHSFTVNLANTLISIGEIDEAARLLADTPIDEATAPPDLAIRATIVQARLALALQQLDQAAAAIEHGITLARRADLRRLLADLLYLRSQHASAAGRRTDAELAWEEASKLYAMLHMPQAKLQPTWLGDGT